jgi:hypothetical protein
MNEVQRDLHGWVSPLFHFIRYAKAHGDLRNKTAKAAFANVEKTVRSWNRQELKGGKCPWRVWFKLSRDDAETEFVGAWDAIRYLPGDTPLQGAWEQARCGCNLPDSIAAKRPEGYAKFIALAAQLQVEMGDRNIFLPVEEVAEVMDVTTTTVSRYRRWAIADGFLVEVKKAVRGSRGKGTGRATEFRFNIACSERLAELAQEGTQVSFERAKRTNDQQSGD